MIDRLILSAVERRMSPLGSTGVLVASLLGVGLLGLLDWASGAEISFSIFYVLPVSGATWFAGMRSGVAVAFCSTARPETCTRASGSRSGTRWCGSAIS
jgi:hypothetical protein